MADRTVRQSDAAIDASIGLPPIAVETRACSSVHEVVDHIQDELTASGRNMMVIADEPLLRVELNPALQRIHVSHGGDAIMRRNSSTERAQTTAWNRFIPSSSSSSRSFLRHDEDLSDIASVVRIARSDRDGSSLDARRAFDQFLRRANSVAHRRAGVDCVRMLDLVLLGAEENH